jgi:hypothetical protein
MFQLRTAIAQIKEHSTLGVQSDIRALCLWLVMETGRKSSDFWNWLRLLKKSDRRRVLVSAYSSSGHFSFPP